MPDDGELLTIKQAAEVLGMTVERIRWLCLADRLPCTREGRRRNSRYLIRRCDAEALRELLWDDKTRAGNDPTQSQRQAVARVVPAVTQAKEAERSQARRETATTDGRELLTTREVAEMLGVPRRRISHLCISDRIPHIREIGQMKCRYRIRRRDAEALRERFRRDTTTPTDI